MEVDRDRFVEVLAHATSTKWSRVTFCVHSRFPDLGHGGWATKSFRHYFSVQTACA